MKDKMKITHKPISFPKDFTWGVATAAPQIEGAARSDGKGESTWEHFARRQGHIHNGDNLDVACDHYHKFPRDFALMRKLGVKNYRLSIAWPRIIPEGAGTVNQKGLDYYHRLFDSMEENGITPWVTMFHWDTPQALEVDGGWRNRRTAEAFARYAEVIVKEFRSQVKNWFTLNEIRCFTFDSYAGKPRKAPGIPESAQVVNQTVHHTVLAHGFGVQAVREHGGRGARVGLVDNLDVFIPVQETEEHIAAARRAFEYHNDQILGAIANGRYSPLFLRICKKDRPIVKNGDFDVIGLPTDFTGLNIYTGNFVRPSKGGKQFETLDFPAGFPRTTLNGWLKTTPQAMYWGTRLTAEIYGAKTIYITENGYGALEEPDANGEVIDLHRRDYLRQYLAELHRAIGDGVPVRGYFCWTFMDNFEWADGYASRFGLFRTDYATQKRTPKLSAEWYSKVIRSNRLV